MVKDSKLKGAPPQPPPATPKRPGRRPMLEGDERGLLVRHHLDSAAEALGLNPEAGAKRSPEDWERAFGHWQRAKKLAGGDPQAMLPVDEAP